MAIVPTEAPSQGPQLRPVGLVPNNNQNTAASFGAAGGQAFQGLGNQLQTTAQAVAVMGAEDDTRQAKAMDVKMSAGIRGVAYGDGTTANPGFYSQQGINAVNGQGGAVSAMQKVRDDLMADPNYSAGAKRLFAQSADMRLESEHTRVSHYVLGQRRVADNGASEARLNAATDDAVARWNDPSALAGSAAIVNGEISGLAVRNGWTPEEAAEKGKQQLSGMYTQVIRAATEANTDAGGALYARLQDSLTGTDRVKVATFLHPKLVAAQGRSIANTAWAEATGAGMSGSGSGSFPDQVRVESGGNQFTKDGVTPLESMPGDPDSPVGAGQIKPSTARDVAKANGITFDLNKLRTDKEYNLQLSGLYRQQMDKQFNGDVVLANAAYNAGPGNVEKWLTQFGDPRTGGVTYQDWAAKLPFKETRDYIRKTGALASMDASNPQGPVYPDFGAAQRRVIEQTANDPEVQSAALSQLHNKMSIYSNDVAVQAGNLRNQAKDDIAKLHSGDDSVAIPYMAIRHAFQPAQAKELIQNYEDAKFSGRVLTQIQWSSPAQVEALRAQVSAGLGPLASQGHVVKGNAEVPDADGTLAPQMSAAAAARATTMFDAVRANQRKLIAADAATYVRSNPTVAAAYAAVKPGDQASLSAAVNASYATQRTLGVAETDLRTLPNAEIEADVRTLESTPPEGGDMRKGLQDLQRKYGPDMFRNVMKDLVRVGKLPPEYSMLSIIPTDAAANNYQRALKAKHDLGKQFGSSIPSLQKTNMGDVIDSRLAGFAATSTPFDGGKMMASVVRPAIETLATYYANSSGDMKAAVQRAVNETVGAAYDTDGALRTPKGLMSDTQQVGQDLQRRLTKDDLGPNTSVAEAQKGFYVSNPDGDGVTLMALRNGNPTPVRDNKGGYVGFKFSDLPTLMQSKGSHHMGAGGAGLVKQGLDPLMQNKPVGGVTGEGQ